MKYIFTTLAVGDSYLKNASECYTKYSELCSADFNITTNEKCEVGSKVNLDLFNLDKYDDGNPGFSFFLNLKVLSLKYCLDKGYDYIIYNDADWRMTENFSEDKLFIKEDKRNIVIHPGIMTHRHGVRPIISGERYAIVSFCNLK